MNDYFLEILSLEECYSLYDDYDICTTIEQRQFKIFNGKNEEEIYADMDIDLLDDLLLSTFYG